MKLLHAVNIFMGLTLASLSAAALGDTRVAILNAEDMAPLDGGNWVIASSMQGGLQAQGGIYAIDARSNIATKIYPLSGASDTSSMPECPAPVAAEAFAPHGITVHKQADGSKRLYVVNHGRRESIEVFDVQQGATPALHWAGCIPTPKGTFGNAVALADDGTLFMTNMGTPLDGSAAISPMGGDVLSWTARNGWRTVPNSAIAAPNGLLTSADGRQLYVASWSQGELFKLTVNGNTASREVIRLSLLPDNLRWNNAGNIFVTGHRTTVAAVYDCFTAKGRCAQSIPSAITEIEPQSFTPRCSHDTEQSMATTAINVGKEIWIGTARGESVLRVPRARLNCSAGK